MSNNVTLPGSSGTDYTYKTTEGAGSVHTPHHNVDKVASVVSAVNSSTSVLTNDTDFTGTYESVRDYAEVIVSATADQDSDPLGLVVNWSQDGTNTELSETFTVLTSIPFSVTLPARMRYVQVVYQNGGTTQTAFRLQTSYKTHATGGVARSRVLTPTITLDTAAAYTAGDSIGGKITLANAGLFSRLKAVTITDESAQSLAGTILLFSRNPTAATITDQAAFVFSTDIAYVVGRVTFPSYTTIDSSQVGQVELDLPIEARGEDLYAAIVPSNAPDWSGGAATDLVINFHFEY